MTESNDVPGPCKHFNFWHCQVSVQLWEIFSPIVIIVGVSGNLLSVAVLSRRRMCNSTTSVYLRWLAVVDTLVLLIGHLREYIYYVTNIDIRELNDFTCRIHYWLALNLTALSGWMLCVLTVDRLICVKMPLWSRTTCSKKSALVIALSVTGLMFFINAHILFFLERTEIRVPDPQTNSTIVLDVRCYPSKPGYLQFWKTAWPLIILTLYSLFPIVFLITCNGLLIKELRENNNPRVLSNSLTLNSVQRKDFRSVSRMLIAVCIFFTVISLPSVTFLIVEPYLFRGTSPEDISKRRLSWTFASLLMYLNNAANFYLYCLSEPLFRKELRDMVFHTQLSDTLQSLLPV